MNYIKLNFIPFLNSDALSLLFTSTESSDFFTMKCFLICVSLFVALIGLCVSSSTAGRQNVVTIFENVTTSRFLLIQ